MATVDMAAVSMPETTLSRTLRLVSPRLFYVCSGTRISDSTQETWVSRGAPDLRAATHLGGRVLGSYYLQGY